MIQTGGTLFECANTLEQNGSLSVSAFCTHGIFPNDAWKRFATGGDRAIFRKIFLTNSNPVRCRLRCNREPTPTFSR